ncbi:undecaprenyldiphospho-muramoylpentapeptide beta-N-acetylglucosaminyltransferase [Fervidibacillus halotolerans]|uniref:UDP-N-acetylglucosamine--N-acetylmuramyl-(pentapeptide) pyrophosphoryl-undecaprenol N-acetylglucosamine transferase n=1 Tax=Fervidibacillus halotolerans TaxID=2980027 RepID=A0A9E8RZ94_9BACI|nr:undecaprenyldiphospho-muramoylpentapeptide beta-N-acetylglucosaminyltransferase [Fervidibacillus halotolerans]WAA13681.1 undecaprenyldiphospho-muramoylpentapeptide beta-N-acetylglucosaminyltransferase [Fervidibacillus halotolerans]
MRIIVSGGGTGGHIYPALAFSKTVQKLDRQAEILYIGTERGLESKIVPESGIPFQTIDITGLKRKLSIDNVKTVIKFLKGVKESKRIIKEFKPDLVVGMGGYVSAPVVYAASRLNVPSLIHEQNSIPGLTNKLLSRFVDKIAISFEDSARYFPADKVVVTGNPRATEVLGRDGKRGKQSIGLDLEKTTVLIFGGSRGARPINEAVLKILSDFGTRTYQVLYITGEIHYEAVKREAALAGNAENVKIVPFIHNMPEILAGTDLVVSRAGATSISEFTSIGLPSILIPSPYVTNNHQEKNAELLQKANAAVVILEKDLSGKRLLEEIDRIVDEKGRLEQMKKAAKSLGVQDAAYRLYDVCKSLVKENAKK